MLSQTNKKGGVKERGQGGGMGREKARRRGAHGPSEKLKWMIVRQRANNNWRQRERGQEEERDDA